MDTHLSLLYGFSFLTAVLAFAFAAYLYLWVKKQSVENVRIIEVSALIKEGANTFMRREYGILARFAAVAAVLILLFLPSPIWGGNPLPNIEMAVSYLAGTILSAIAGKIGGHAVQRTYGGSRPEGHQACLPDRISGRRRDGAAGGRLLSAGSSGRSDAF